MTSASDIERPSVSEIARQLADNIGSLAISLLGNPKQRGGHEWRWGSKGSLGVVVRGPKRGRWFDHEAGRGGDALELVKVARGDDFRGAIAWARDSLGHPDLPARQRSANAAPSKAGIAVDNDDARRTEYAMRIWAGAVSVRGTAAETYLRHRGIELPADVCDLAFHPACPVTDLNGRLLRLPAMVALMRNVVTNEPQSLHRTFVKDDGSGKVDAAQRNIQNAKMVLGPSKGAVIKLADDADVTLGVAIGEGLENCLTWAAAGWWPIWAAPDVGHVKTFPVLDDGIEALTIFADNKKPGDINAARECALRWNEAGKHVDIRVPPTGADWNDVVKSTAA